ncbi:uncharacterized protein L969DRAFT_100400 [Mixia osmundae IAM 14324]|uniref:Gamma interferon inducible lysosomal thiol reductase GILT n=1 Tax=Mixia osmundae (strain CBS 9802 / IAM 14324 / JCM 22182 / KY 12970) TaxID=764103 RepID=G7E4M1_MIXOS|nr:uncharacterized protein L969DRAFT_100400 [Mixia osmundae IAM 14324]KEI41839.1 hypothetical protein L969DRAFT_100400 [Mixia osmundae IAM 14324]GAA97781.1 hypothetical protein E5Q_04460 [Mixia osmundae IAM 14324]
MLSSTWLLAGLLASAHAAPRLGPSNNGLTFQSPDRLADEKQLVSVKLAVMSQCPDAQICEQVWDKTIPKVADKITLELVYIGKLDQRSKYGVKCMHGELECAGNIQQLCFARHFPNYKEWWPFVSCQNYGSLKNVGTESVARSCAKVAGKDWDADGLASCASGERGARLLRESVRIAEYLGVEKSCSVLLNDRVICIHDGTWKSCSEGHEVSDFVRQVEDEYRRINAYDHEA